MIADPVLARVERILCEVPASRSSDARLIEEYALRYSGKVGFSFESTGLTFTDMRTINRYRAKLQKQRPDLQATEQVRAWRANMQDDMKTRMVG